MKKFTVVLSMVLVAVMLVMPMPALAVYECDGEYLIRTIGDMADAALDDPNLLRSNAIQQTAAVGLGYTMYTDLVDFRIVDNNIAGVEAPSDLSHDVLWNEVRDDMHAIMFYSIDTNVCVCVITVQEEMAEIVADKMREMLDMEECYYYDWVVGY